MTFPKCLRCLASPLKLYAYYQTTNQRARSFIGRVPFRKGKIFIKFISDEEHRDLKIKYNFTSYDGDWMLA